MAKGSMWECGCSHIEYGKMPPQECPECASLGSFVLVPEEEIEEREAEKILSTRKELESEEYED